MRAKKLFLGCELEGGLKKNGFTHILFISKTFIDKSCNTLGSSASCFASLITFCIWLNLMLFSDTKEVTKASALAFRSANETFGNGGWTLPDVHKVALWQLGGAP